VLHRKTNFINIREIAAVAVKALTEPRHENQAYKLTGSQALNYEQVADILSRALGRKITYRDPSLPAFIRETLRNGKPLGMTLVMGYLYTQTKRGMAEKVTGSVREILGRDPISLEQFVETYKNVWA
jgi:uncharacterized protein YbjT (DUF2867 family)